MTLAVACTNAMSLDWQQRCTQSDGPVQLLTGFKGLKHA
jgi:hypothetical protein